MTNLSHPEILGNAVDGRDLLKRAYAAGLGIAAGVERRIKLDSEYYPGEDFDHGNVLPAAKPSASKELTPEEQIGRQELIDFLMS